MTVDVISYTKRGYELSERLKSIGVAGKLYTGCSALKGSADYVADMTEVVENHFFSRTPLLFVGATGIAVRSVAPYLKDKTKDPAILVMDEKGSFVIPLVSGHIGGANEMAIEIAKAISATPVITTATDINSAFAVDIFAKKNHLHISDKGGIAEVSAKVLRGDTITIAVESSRLTDEVSLPEHVKLKAYPPDSHVDVVITDEKNKYDASLELIPRKYVVGAGCRKDKDIKEFESFIDRTFYENGIDKESIAAIASIDLKKDEACIKTWARRNDCEFVTYDADTLNDIPGDFAASTFVKEKTGVSNVCERAAVAASRGGDLVVKRTAENGMTLAVAETDWRVSF